MTRSERGGATLHVLFAAVLLFTALVAATLWSAVSTARHRLTAAADLTALSAAQSLTASQYVDPDEPHAAITPPKTPCETAARTAALNKVRLTACQVTSTAVTVQVSLQLNLRFTQPTMTSIARAGPV
jgi:secretion/DNA translocation related TadE-like protein